MTIEEYDAKAYIRQIIKEIDRCLKVIEDSEKDDALIKLKGVGVYSYFLCSPINRYIEDEVLMKRFKQLLLDRKQ